MPSPSMKTGSLVVSFRLPHDSTTSPVCSAIQAAPAAPSAINNRNRMIRIIENLTAKSLLRRFAERCHGVGRKFTGGGQRGVARVGPFKPGLRHGAIVRLQRL